MWGLVTAGRTPILSGWLAAIHTSWPTLVNLIFLFTSNFWYLSMRVFVFLYFHTSWPSLVNLIFLFTSHFWYLSVACICISIFPHILTLPGQPRFSIYSSFFQSWSLIHCIVRNWGYNPRTQGNFGLCVKYLGVKQMLMCLRWTKILDSRNLHNLPFIFLIGCFQRVFCSLVIFRNILMILYIMIDICKEEMADNLSETNQQKKGEVTLPKG